MYCCKHPRRRGDICSTNSYFIKKEIVKRNNSNVGDAIFVTGNLGDSFMGLGILKKKIYIKNKLKSYFVKKYFKPDLPISIIKYLFNFASSSIDISDGLFDDLNKLINNQKIGFNIYADKIPISIPQSDEILSSGKIFLRNENSPARGYLNDFIKSK